MTGVPKNGYWWYTPYGPGDAEIVRIVDGEIFFCGTDISEDWETMNGVFTGPLTPPNINHGL